MSYHYTEDDYSQAIKRELGKRATTYPKIIAKKVKQLMPIHEIDEMKIIMDAQNIALKEALNHVDHGFSSIKISMDWLLEELIREYKMRKKCFGWFIILKRMKQETADYELAVWKELCIWFAEVYLFDKNLAIQAMEPKRRKRFES